MEEFSTFIINLSDRMSVELQSMKKREDGDEQKNGGLSKVTPMYISTFIEDQGTKLDVSILMTIVSYDKEAIVLASLRTCIDLHLIE